MPPTIRIQRRFIAVVTVLLICVCAAPARAQDPPPVTETPLGIPVEATATLPPIDTPPPAAETSVAVDPNVTPEEVPTAAVEVVATLAPPPQDTPEPPEVFDPLIHRAQVGETLESVAAFTALPADELARANRITRGDLLVAGQRLRLPAAAGAAVRLHRVTPGETLFSIAAQYGVSPDALRLNNTLACATCLVAGTTLRIPPARDAISASKSAAESGLPEPFSAIKINPQLPKQGDLIVISVTTNAPLQSLVGTLAGRPLNFVQKDGAYLALSGVGAVQEAGVYSVSLRSLTLDGVPGSVNGRIQIGAGQFAFENLVLGQKLLPLLALDVNLEERAALDGIFNRNFTGAQYWSGPLVIPVTSKIVSYYGTRRNFNRGLLSTFHSGIDLPARAGTPISAAAPGKVVAVQKFPVRGNVVIIDHGRSVFTVYCHLSKFSVALGDLVETGTIIGNAGNTGRSLGPHLHFELAVGGVTINPLPWLAREIP